ncbi:MAG: hypothetical protein AAB425_13580 [Bdellovibrionota bacterium]
MNQILLDGFSFEPVGARLMVVVAIVGRWLVWVVDFAFWGKRFPMAVTALISGSGRVLAGFDAVIVRMIERAGRLAVVIPAKTLQLVQNGDVQWYLFFGLSCGVVVGT